MIDILVFLALGAFLLTNGGVLLYRPSLLLESYNRFYAKLLGENQWFWHDTEAVKKGGDLWSARAGGILMVFVGLHLVRDAFLSLFQVLASGSMPLRGHPAARPSQSVRTMTWEAHAVGTVVAVAAIAIGFVLAVSPRTGAKMLGEGRYFKSRIPSWVWRAVGVGSCVIGAVTLAQSVGWD